MKDIKIFGLLVLSLSAFLFFCYTNSANAQENKELNYEKFDVGFYFIDLKVNDTSTYLSGSVTIKAKVLEEDFDTVMLELSDSLHIDSVIINNELTSYSHISNLLYIDLPHGIALNSTIDICVFYQGFGQAGWLGGMSNTTNSYEVPYTWTLSEPYGAMLWFPCKQDLADKADSAYIFLTIPVNRMAGSNGVLTNITTINEDEVRYEWITRHPIAYYLISVCVGDYRDYSFDVAIPGIDEPVLVQNFLYNNDEYEESVKEKVDLTGDFLILFSELFGPYPYADEKYGHCTAPFGGGMEHQTMSTMGFYGFQIVNHELAHQWFGDLVTCKTWQDIWINEGFASYAEYLALEFIRSKEDADEDMAGVHDFVKTEATGAVYVPFEDLDDVWRIFSGRLSYKKGSAIIHMMRHEIDDDDLFFEMLRNYVYEYRNNVATADDFRESMEQTTGIDFTGFFEQWFYGEGYPIFDITWQQSNDTLYITSLQTGSAPHITGLFNTKLDFKIYTYNGIDTTVTFRQTANYNEFILQVDDKVLDLEFDPGKWILKDVNSMIKILPEKLLNDWVILYPTITISKFHVEVFDSLVGKKYTIVKNNGSIVVSDTLTNLYMEIDASNFKSGLYFFIVYMDDTVIKKKFSVL